MEGKFMGWTMLTFMHEFMRSRLISPPSFFFSDQAEVKEINLIVLKVIVYLSYHFLPWFVILSVTHEVPFTILQRKMILQQFVEHLFYYFLWQWLFRR